MNVPTEGSGVSLKQIYLPYRTFLCKQYNYVVVSDGVFNQSKKGNNG